MMTTLITGASKGIGQALAYEFAKHGHDLVISARDQQLLEQLAGIIHTKYSVNVDIIPMDLSRVDSASNLIEAVERRGLQVDCLVNNAGIGYLGDFTSMDEKYLNELLQLNIVTLSELTRHYANQFIKSRKGKILQVASIAAFQPGPQMAAYYASKAYVTSLSQALAYELKGSGVSISILCPGPTQTNFLHASMEGSRLSRGNIGILSAEKVAQKAYRGLENNKLFIIPGMFNKILAYSASLSPDVIKTRIAAFLHRKNEVR